MANEFKVRKGLVVNGSGSVILDVQGSQGQLFSVTDVLSGSLFAVKDISGMPIIEAFSDDRVNIGTFNREAIKVSGSVASVTGSFSGSFTGSLFGTSSQATSASFSTFAYSASFAPGFSVSMSQATPALTWSFTHNLNSRNPVVQVYDTTYAQIIPNQIVGMNNSTAEIRFDYAQAGYAVFSNGGGLYVTGSTSTLVQTVGAATWSFTHNLNNKYNTYEVYDNNDYVLIPSAIKAVDNNSAELYFSGLQTGRAIAQFSGINGAPNATTASYALTASFILPLSQSVIVTGSLLINGASTTLGSTTTSTTALNIISSVRADIFLKSGGSSDTTLDIYTFGGAYGSNYAQIGVNDGINSANQGGAIYLDSRAIAPPIRFVVKGTGTTTMTTAGGIQLNGNWGIGTTTDAGFRLDVSGSTRITNNLTVSGSTQITGSGTTNSTLDITGIQANSAVNPPKGTISLYYDGVDGATAGVYGASVIFSQRYNAVTAAPIAIGMIAGVKVNSGGNFGGGLTFWTSDETFNNLAERARIDVSGRMAIGHKSPTALLHVSGSGSGSLMQISSHVSSSIFYVSGSGNVGIGITSPTAKLHISGSGRDSLFQISSTVSSSIFFVSGSGNVGINTVTPSVPLSFGSDVGNKIALYDAGSTTTIYGFGIQSSLLQIFANTSTNRVGIGYGNSTSFTETLTVKGSNVGVNKTSPSASLDVSGSMLMTGSFAMSGSYTQTGYKILTTVSQSLNYSDDTAAAAGGVPLGGLYRNGNFILIRLS